MDKRNLSERINQSIEAHYVFRKNFQRMTLGDHGLEYKRIEWDYWMPSSQFAKYEGERIKWLSKAKPTNRILGLFGISIDNLIQKAAMEFSQSAEISEKDGKMSRLVTLPPVRVHDVDPLPTSERTAVEAEVGDLCYVCLGADNKNNRKHTALPGFVESIHYEDGQKLYNLLVVKSNVKTAKIVYHGRHLVFSNEIGSTPKQAVQNLAFSQIIY